MSVQKIQSVYTVVDNMDALQAFYSQFLGLQPKFRDKNRWTQFCVGNTNFALSSAEEAAPGAAGSVIVFEAAGLDGIRESVEGAGGKFVGERDMDSHGKVLTFKDPEGHPFQVFSKSTPTTSPPPTERPA
jgi:predicted enzyme related to lactoylglutathione lyase